MLISASIRTDIPAFYGVWFQRRLDAGFCHVLNPYNQTATIVPLTADAVGGFVFWTKFIGPFHSALAAVADRGLPFVVQHTLTGYPRAFEARVPAVDRALAAMRAVAAAYGPRVLVWRYDPIILSSATPPAWHRAHFARLAAALAGATDEVVVSFVQSYAKTRRRLDAAAVAHGLTWEMPTPDAQRALLADLAAVAAAHGMRLTLCAQPALAGVPGTAPARCVDVERLSAVAGYPVPGRTHGNRAGCLCAAAVDIGAYDTCPHGCVYCYAVSDDARARFAWRRHDPASPFLLEPVTPPTRWLDLRTAPPAQIPLL